MSKILIYGCLLAAFTEELRAGYIQLAPDQELIVQFGLPGFVSTESPTSLPSTVGLQIALAVPNGSATAAIPGSSQSYYTGIMLQASLVSTDGSMILPLFDADSWRLGLATGTLVADETGTNTGVLSGALAVTLNQAEAIFGASGQAEFVIQNTGSAITIGLGPGYSLSNAILVPLTANTSNGSVATGGYIENMQASSPFTASLTTNDSGQTVPEPLTFAMATMGGAALIWVRKRLKL